ncbi:hypothetical protein M011DRAFT_460369 [Sporormia fimetaria CBS 119925]|uniref:Uncharacterized protein n=1 Tax=Sporormia fimetaria CBS 119925 TaxID=1340428 RepID=A0A6A6V5K7_9PLEO|nr:hypothetical protein M011DRAFT_460369 [Sporormia fimetaria CBS 119925]
MAGPGLQLFPPPPRAQRQTSPQRSPDRRQRSPTPEAIPQRVDAPKAPRPADFHELVIQVNSVPVSPSSSIAPPASIAPPPRAHIPQAFTRTPPPESRPTFETPPRAMRSTPVASPELGARSQSPRAPSPSDSTQPGHQWPRPANASPDPSRAVSPAFSTSATLVRANSNAAPPVRAVSPQDEIPMRSMFPVYDPTVSLPHQQYKPTQASPTHIPFQTSRSPYSPDFYIPHGTLTSEENQTPAPKPFFTPSNLLDNLWVACNGQDDPAVQLYTLRMHRATAHNPTITFGPTPSLPFYSLAQSNLAGDHEIPSVLNEVLIQRHHPTQPRVLPIAQLDLIAPPSLDTRAFDPNQEPTTLVTSIYPKLAALAALDAAAHSPRASHIALNDPGATSPAAQRLAEDVLMGAAQRECCALSWTRDSSDQPTNPWARHMPSEGSYQLHHPTLGTFPIKLDGDCSVINKPSTRPVTAMYAHNMPATPPSVQKAATITLLNPYILSPTSPRSTALNSPYGLGVGNYRPDSMTPSVMDVTQLPTATDATADDSMLARLDFSTDSLTLNLGALTRFGNPFLVDVVASTLLAVAVAEAKRGRSSRRGTPTTFDAPPPSSVLTAKQEPSDAQAFKGSFLEGFHSWGGKAKKPAPPAGLKKWRIEDGTERGEDEDEG